jgi:hypothetical protein
MPIPLTKADCLGLVRPAVDAHTLGLSSVDQILHDCGYATVTAGADVCAAFDKPWDRAGFDAVPRWLKEHRVTALGLSYRLNPADGAAFVTAVIRALKDRRLLQPQGGPIRTVYFAGLPQTCRMVGRQCPEVAGVFQGDETPSETLRILGIDPGVLPRALAEGMAYDEARLSFGQDLIRRAGHLAVPPVDRSGYEGFGTRQDTLVARLRHSARRGLGPLFRAHVGPYLPDRAEAVRLFLEWARQLAASGFLDVLSIGTSQLTQSDFGHDWGSRPNGGGVPLNAREEFAAAWEASRPMLVRTYAGTRDIPALARMYEETIHIAWHALSLWWFCQIDGRGPHPVRENLRQHLETLRYVAATGKPFEPNVPHHFAFRGADDVTYVVSAVLAARTAKSLGVRRLIFQNMLNTPRYTWGVQDLAKSRATLGLLRELQDERFEVILQPRGGLDYFSPDLDKARAQLAAATALMDDIEPHDPASPPIIHVVSYSEASHLADPPVIDESIQITRHALTEYRRLRAHGEVDDMTRHPEVQTRTAELRAEARTVLGAIETAVPEPYSAEGLYQVFAAGFLPVPYLWEGRDEFARAVRWSTRLIRGSMKVVDENGLPLPAAERMRRTIHDMTR